MPGIRDGLPPRGMPPIATDRAATAGRPSVPTPKARPDARPLRIAFGMGAVATASALITAFAGPGAGSATTTVQTSVTQPVDPAPSVKHLIQYVQLKPGQTAPPKAVVKQAPAPPPKVVVVTTTRQSGGKR
jgi:hypothetical protein